MKKIIILLIALTMLSSCSKDTWQWTYYPEWCLSCTDKYIFSQTFEDFDTCKIWAYNQMRGSEDKMHCWKNCTNPEWDWVQKCEEVIRSWKATPVSVTFDEFGNIDDKRNYETVWYYILNYSKEYENKNYWLALENINSAISLVPSESDFYTKLWYVYSGLWNEEEANDSHLQAIELDWNNIKSLTVIANNHYEEWEYEIAIKMYDKITALNDVEKDNIFVYMFRWNAFVELSQYKEAIADYDILLKYLPIDVYYDARALARFQIGDYKWSLEDAEKTIKLSPHKWYWYYRRAMANAQLRNTSNMCNDFRKAFSNWTIEAQQAIDLLCI